LIPPGVWANSKRSTAVPHSVGAGSPPRSLNPRPTRRRRGRGRGAFFFFLIAALGASLASATTRVETISRVVDGDTVVLESGEIIRLAGINTPELAKKDQPDQPLAFEARDALVDLIGGRSIQIYNAPGHKDRYGRTLAYLLMPEGDTVQERLVRMGLASVVVIAPNDLYLAELSQAEDDARSRRIGIWGLSYYDTKAAQDTTGGYQFASGQVSRLDLKQDWFSVTIAERLVILIKRVDWQDRFPYSVLDLDQARVAVRGWVSAKKNRSTVVVNHPFMIERCDIDPRRLCP